MPPRTSLLSIIFVSAFALATPAKAQIAITEILTNPSGGDDDIFEFFELFNFSLEPVNIAGWTLINDDEQSLVLADTDLIIPSGGFLVYAANKTELEADFFEEVPQDRVIGYDATEEGFEFGNSSAEIILLNNSGIVVWSHLLR